MIKEVNAPNFLTTIRLALAFVFLYTLIYSDWKIAVFVYFVAVITDVLDGFIARRYGSVTNFGKAYDGIVDKLFMATIIVAVIIKFQIPLIFALMILTRDILVIIGVLGILIKVGSWKKLKSLDFSSRTLGKATTFFQVITIVLVFFDHKYLDLFVYGVAVLGIIAVIDYYSVWKDQLQLD